MEGERKLGKLIDIYFRRKEIVVYWKLGLYFYWKRIKEMDILRKDLG